mmetsp:Transcript_44369/g.87658  ORF Transcript_44369/g.87658 Transcript_44369/m.87658 type:complete len:236 (-) Transcript_44369:1091-1798(-)
MQSQTASLFLLPRAPPSRSVPAGIHRVDQQTAQFHCGGSDCRDSHTDVYQLPRRLVIILRDGVSSVSIHTPRRCASTRRSPLPIFGDVGQSDQVPAEVLNQTVLVPASHRQHRVDELFGGSASSGPTSTATDCLLAAAEESGDNVWEVGGSRESSEHLEGHCAHRPIVFLHKCQHLSVHFREDLFHLHPQPSTLILRRPPLRWRRIHQTNDLFKCQETQISQVPVQRLDEALKTL